MLAKNLNSEPAEESESKIHTVKGPPQEASGRPFFIFYVHVILFFIL